MFPRQDTGDESLFPKIKKGAILTLMEYISNGRTAGPVTSFEKMWVSVVFPLRDPVRVTSRLLSLSLRGAGPASSSTAGR